MADLKYIYSISLLIIKDHFLPFPYFQVSPLKYVMDGTTPLRVLGLKDETRTIKCALFQDNAEISYTSGNVVKIQGVYSKQFHNQPQLTSSSKSPVKVEVTIFFSIQTKKEINIFPKNHTFFKSIILSSHHIHIKKL